MRDTGPPVAGHPVTIAAFYRFFDFPDFRSYREPLLRFMEERDVRGTILLAPEGVNGTVSSDKAALDALHERLVAIPGNAAMTRKLSLHAGHPFRRSKVKLKRELITLGEPADPRRGVGRYVKPEDWNALLDRPDIVLLDARNRYETRFGGFPGAIDPATETFTGLPERSRALLPAGSSVATYCTGGIRCEKYTAWLRDQGYENVFHLEGGILAYLEKVPPSENRFEGSCYVFDERIALDKALVPRPATTRCPACGQAYETAASLACPACAAQDQAA